jgi:predicted peptidase
MRSRWILIGLIFSLLIVSCGIGKPDILTGVHLQGTFAIPNNLKAFPGTPETMQYLLYLPEGFGDDPDKKWPLIFFLHGAGDVDNDSGWVMSYGLPAVLYLDEQPENFEFVVVSPQAFPSVPWWEGTQLLVLDAMLDEVIANYQVDPDRIYLTGLSMGGYGSWFMATRYPERFAAMVSISGSGYRTFDLPDPEIMCKLDSTPVYGIHGATDIISNAEAVEYIFRYFQENCSGETKWTMYPDVGHFGAYTRAYRDPALYEWMLAHSR